MTLFVGSMKEPLGGGEKLEGKLKDAEVSWVRPEDLERAELVEYVFGVADELWELFMREWDVMGAVKVRASNPGATSML